MFRDNTAPLASYGYSIADRIILNRIWDLFVPYCSFGGKVKTIKVATIIIWIGFIYQWIMEAYYNLKVVSNSVYFILSIVIMLSGILWNVYYAYHRKSHSYNNEKGYYICCQMMILGVALICCKSFHIGPSLTLCSLLCLCTLLFLWQWRLFYSNENFFPFHLFGETEVMITAVVINIITAIYGPSLWQITIDFGIIAGIQINHIFYLILLVYTVIEGSSFIRTGIHIAKSRKKTVFWDEMISVSPKEISWLIMWIIGSFSWCYSSPNFYQYSETFILSVHLSFSILYIHIILQRENFRKGDLYHHIILVFLIPTLNNLIFPIVSDIFISKVLCIGLCPYWIYQITNQKQRPKSKIILDDIDNLAI